MERWKSLTLVNGYYDISKYGDVRQARTREGRVKGRILKSENEHGYRRVTLCIDGRQKHYFVHVLVAHAFIGPKPEGKEVNHKDRNRSNNYYRNLGYLTPVQNRKYSTDKGAKIGSTKLTPDEVLSIRFRFAHLVETKRSIAEDWNLNPTTIEHIVSNDGWKHVGGPIFPKIKNQSDFIIHCFG